MTRTIGSYLLLALAGSSIALAQNVPGDYVGTEKGPQAVVSPYMIPAGAFNPTPNAFGVKFVSVVTNGRGGTNLDPDITYPKIGGGVYRLFGITDGAGSFQTATDRQNGTFTHLVNHEVGGGYQQAAGAASARAHGGWGATVSDWTIKADPTDLAVIGGEDLIKTVRVWNGTSYVNASGATNNLGRFCSADLALPSAYSFGSLGTDEALFLNGEEVGPAGRGFAHIASGPNTGISYEIPATGKFSWENAVTSPYPQAKTVMIGLDDATPGNVFVYVGNKTGTGTEVERAGLTNGIAYTIAVNGATLSGTQRVEDPLFVLGNSASGRVESKRFFLVNLGDVTNKTGAQQQTEGDAAGQLNMLRPEDGCWSLRDKNVFYFLTTDTFSRSGVAGSSRLWQLKFDDITDPAAGGTLTMLIDGGITSSLAGGIETRTTGAQAVTDIRMMDNMGINRNEQILIQEDVGNNSRLGRMWLYDVKTDKATEVGISDPQFFLSGAPKFLTIDEESSGVHEVTDILGSGWWMLNMQAHYTVNQNFLAEGGQLMAAFVPETVQLCEVDVGGQGGVTTPDGRLDNNDFAAFITLFFNNDTRVDVGSQGGVIGKDGMLDNNDFAAFITIFFSGCGFNN
jgi:hypothetical protein